VTDSQCRALRLLGLGLAVGAAVVVAPYWAALLFAAWAADLLHPAIERLERLLGGRRRSAAAIVVLVVVAFLVPVAAKRPPRDPREPLFGRRVVVGLGVLQGASVLVVVLAVYAASLLPLRDSENEVRALTFSTFHVSNLALIFTNRSWSKSGLASSLRDKAFWAIAAGAVAFLGLVVYVPVLAALFRFGKLHPMDWALCFVGGLRARPRRGSAGLAPVAS